MYHFDETNSREFTGSRKWDCVPQLDHGVVPLTVADMEFMTCPVIIKALDKRVSNGIFGYTKPDREYYQSIIHWRAKKYEDQVEQEEIISTSSVIPALVAAVRTCTKEHEGVIAFSPVYTGFYTSIERTGRVVVESRLRLENDEYQIDFEDLEVKAKDPMNRLLMLCNPHNPVGRVWRREELERILTICEANGVMIVVDEIHADLTFTEEFVTFHKIEKEGSQKAIVCTSPSKAFNLGGLHVAYCIIKDSAVRRRFKESLYECGIDEDVSAFGYVATIAAYEHGMGWLKELVKYIEGNFAYLEQWLAEHQPKIRMMKAEGTYLAWLDCRELGQSQEDLMKQLQGNQIYVTDGLYFGEGGRGFIRMNLALPLPYLKTTLSHFPTIC